ncbi:MAG: DUF2442 domain-containing protein [Caldilineaceae bacterium]|nr:DUF2442 domain-containing protein [Caldilineaceae bacterium]
MSIATIEIQPRVESVEFHNNDLTAKLKDGRTVAAPLSWYPRLAHATTEERNHWHIFEDSEGRDIIFWEQLDELIPVIALLVGVPSRESQRSIERWLANRQTPITENVI